MKNNKILGINKKLFYVIIGLIAYISAVLFCVEFSNNSTYKTEQIETQKKIDSLEFIVDSLNGVVYKNKKNIER